MNLKITPEITEEIHKLIVEGIYIEDVCEYVGISKPTFYGWYNKGKAIFQDESKDLENLNEREELYLNFFNSVKKANIKSQVVPLRIIRKAAYENKQWQAAAWFLERRFYQKWGLKTKHNIEGSLINEIKHLTDEDIEKRKKELMKEIKEMQSD